MASLFYDNNVSYLCHVLKALPAHCIKRFPRRGAFEI